MVFKGEFGTPTVFVIDSNGRVLNLDTAVSIGGTHIVLMMTINTIT